MLCLTHACGALFNMECELNRPFGPHLKHEWNPRRENVHGALTYMPTTSDTCAVLQHSTMAVLSRVRTTSSWRWQEESCHLVIICEVYSLAQRGCEHTPLV